MFNQEESFTGLRPSPGASRDPLGPPECILHTCWPVLTAQPPPFQAAGFIFMMGTLGLPSDLSIVSAIFSGLSVLIAAARQLAEALVGR